jgi:hypothetical protein
MLLGKIEPQGSARVYCTLGAAAKGCAERMSVFDGS